MLHAWQCIMLMHCCGFFNHLVNLNPPFSVSSWLFGAGAGNRGFIPARWLRAAAASGAGKPASAVFTNRWCLLRLDHLTLMMLWCFELAPTHHVVVNTILSSLPLAEKKTASWLSCRRHRALQTWGRNSGLWCRTMQFKMQRENVLQVWLWWFRDSGDRAAGPRDAGGCCSGWGYDEL